MPLDIWISSKPTRCDECPTASLKLLSLSQTHVGFTSDASSLSQNKVTVHVAVSAASKGGNAESSAIWARASWITAQRSPPDLQTRFVFNKAKVYGLPGTPTNSTFLGRPWSSNAAVMFQSCELSDIIKPEGWSPWNPPSDPRTQSIQFEEFSNTGPGSRRTRNLGRISKESLSIEKVLGAGFAEWTR
ncbi:hypothetical protein O181_012541 [Austropuccinia psidii MF-1]|uniref:pectinesterase n=1 Tax=Austropuccinia psidii MF-1 TaxID=1389203 RepID=A0A9Q3GME6_9BASI|nr:hypothetical protein [Austropuccinia psidii MF-1]